MEQSNPMVSLTSSYNDFVACVLSIPEALFLSPMNGWTPRDIVAHLIGWNRFMIQSSISILAGEPPAYYTDAPSDYTNINAAFVEYHSSRSRGQLLAELALSITEFESYVADLPASEMTASHGVTHYSGQPATVAKIVRSLTSDYEHHTRQLNAWLRTQRTHPYGK